MTILKNPIYQVDAFATALFKGNAAAVCPLTHWLADELMQSIAAENNLSETAFFVPSEDKDYDYHLRWFTPTAEVDLCGHATLAAAYVLFKKLGFAKDRIRFSSRSSLLTVQCSGKLFSLNFPRWPLEKIGAHEELAKALNAAPVEIYKSHDWLVVLKTQSELQRLKPDFRALRQIDCRGVIVTAPADSPAVDFVSRAFFPKLGIDEDPVTGSAHCALVPYWAERLSKTKFTAQQISARLGELHCEITPDERIIIAGEGQLYLEGQYYLP